MVAFVGDSDRVDVAAPAVASWVATFGGRAVIADVVPDSTVLHGGDAVESLEQFAEGVADPVYLAVSARWTDARFHRHSVTRNLVRRSTTPVLVVPAARIVSEAGTLYHAC